MSRSIFGDIYIQNKIGKMNKMDFIPWLMIKNTGRGIFLVKKIIEKFDPWVTLKIQDTLHKHHIPKEFWEMNQWTKEREREFGTTQLTKK